MPPSSASVNLERTGRDCASGRAIAGARVVISSARGVTQTALTSPFGYFSFSGVGTVHRYVIEASAKRYRFQPRVVNVNDELTGLDITAEP
ncbi:MAG: carboxypeptidase-like regulatory domain-containing protein [Acidobacteriota bacterium]